MNEPSEDLERAYDQANAEVVQLAQVVEELEKQIGNARLWWIRLLSGYPGLGQAMPEEVEGLTRALANLQQETSDERGNP